MMTNHELIDELKSTKYFIEYYNNLDDPLKFDKGFHSINYNPNSVQFRKDIDDLVRALIGSTKYKSFYIDLINDTTKTIYISFGADYNYDEYSSFLNGYFDSPDDDLYD